MYAIMSSAISNVIVHIFQFLHAVLESTLKEGKWEERVEREMFPWFIYSNVASIDSNEMYA